MGAEQTPGIPWHRRSPWPGRAARAGAKQRHPRAGGDNRPLSLPFGVGPKVLD